MSGGAGYPVPGDGGWRGDFEKSKPRQSLMSKGPGAGGAKPLFIPEDTPLIRMLKGAYQAVTGEEAALYGTGGGPMPVPSNRG